MLLSDDMTHQPPRTFPPSSSTTEEKRRQRTQQLQQRLHEDALRRKLRNVRLIGSVERLAERAASLRQLTDRLRLIKVGTGAAGAGGWYTRHGWRWGDLGWDSRPVGGTSRDELIDALLVRMNC